MGLIILKGFFIDVIATECNDTKKSDLKAAVNYKISFMQYLEI